MAAAATAADVSANKLSEPLDVWLFERVSYEGKPDLSYAWTCSGHLSKWTTVYDVKSLHDATLKKEIEGLCIERGFTLDDDDGEPSVENFEKLKLLDAMEADMKLSRISGVPELQVLICSGCALDVHSKRHYFTPASTMSSLPGLRGLVTYDYEMFGDSLVVPDIFPVSLRSLALIRGCFYNYAFLLQLPNLENLYLDLSNCRAHNALHILRQLPYKSKLLRFSTIDCNLLRNVITNNWYSTAQSLLDSWPNLRQLSVDLPDLGATKRKTLRFPSTIRVLKLMHCGPFKLKAPLREYEQLKFIAVYTDHINHKDLKIRRHCYSTKTPYLGNLKVYLQEKLRTPLLDKYKYHFKLSKSSTDDGSATFFDFLHQNLDAYRY